MLGNVTRKRIFDDKMLVENSHINHKKFVQKVVDVSIFWEYYRDSS